MNSPKSKYTSSAVPAPQRAGTAVKNKAYAQKTRTKNVRQSNKRKSYRQKSASKPSWRRMPMWALFAGIGLIVAAYMFLFYYFFVGPFSFRWKAIYGDPDYPDGYDVHGLDVSHYQDRIDWERLRNATIQGRPIRFIFVKATEGSSLIDENFNENFYQARQNDMLRGAYHFFVPNVDAALQAKFFLKQVHLETGDLPPVLDVENAGTLTVPQLQQRVLQWLSIVEKHYGIKPIIYTGYKFKLKYLNSPQFDSYPYWIAHYYVGQLEYKGSWSFWQYTDVGRIDGLHGYVDCNIFNGTLKQLHQLTLDRESIDVVGLHDEN